MASSTTPSNGNGSSQHDSESLDDLTLAPAGEVGEGMEGLEDDLDADLAAAAELAAEGAGVEAEIAGEAAKYSSTHYSTRLFRRWWHTSISLALPFEKVRRSIHVYASTSY